MYKIDDDDIVIFFPETPRKNKYRRLLWAGILNSRPSIDFIVSLNQQSMEMSKSLRQKNLPNNLFPALITWENTLGAKGYAEIDMLGRSIKTKDRK